MFRIYSIVFAILFVMFTIFIGTANAAPAGKPECIPFIKGTAANVAPQVVKGAEFLHVFTFCLRPTTDNVYADGFSCKLDSCSERLLATVLASIQNTTSKITTANRAWTTHIPYRCDAAIARENSERGRLCIERQAVLEANWETWLKN